MQDLKSLFQGMRLALHEGVGARVCVCVCPFLLARGVRESPIFRGISNPINKSLNIIMTVSWQKPGGKLGRESKAVVDLILGIDNPMFIDFNMSPARQGKCNSSLEKVRDRFV